MVNICRYREFDGAVFLNWLIFYHLNVPSVICFLPSKYVIQYKVHTWQNSPPLLFLKPKQLTDHLICSFHSITLQFVAIHSLQLATKNKRNLEAIVESKMPEICRFNTCKVEETILFILKVSFAYHSVY